MTARQLPGLSGPLLSTDESWCCANSVIALSMSYDLDEEALLEPYMIGACLRDSGVCG